MSYRKYNVGIGGIRAEMKKMGRPKSDNAKERIVAVRLTDEEHKRLTMYAERHSLNMSDVLKSGLYKILESQEEYEQ